MPFAAPWKDFAEGELVYGVEKSGTGRRGFIDRFAANPNSGIYTIDQYLILDLESQMTAQARPADQGQFTGALSGHDKYKSAIGGDDDDNSATRRKCKGGLYWQTMVEKKCVHFVLDGLDLDAVVNKSFTGKNPDMGSGSNKNRSITGSELRWIYRNREHADVQNNIQFWSNNAQCPPPWVTDPTLWSRYIPSKSVSVHMAPELDTTPPKKNFCGCTIL